MAEAPADEAWLRRREKGTVLGARALVLVARLFGRAGRGCCCG
jgi:predicted LPLAT superfamily acyltransferase